MYNEWPSQQMRTWIRFDNEASVSKTIERFSITFTWNDKRRFCHFTFHVKWSEVCDFRESGWLSGYQQCLPPLRPGFNSRPRDRMWAEFQSISTWLRGFFSGYSGFPPSAKSTHSLFHQAVVLCSEVIHGSCSGAERLAGSTAPSVQSRWAAPLAIQSRTASKGV